MTRVYRCRAIAAIVWCGLLAAASAAAAQAAATPPARGTVPVDRASRDTWTPVMDVLGASRKATVTEAQLQRLRELPLEAV